MIVKSHITNNKDYINNSRKLKSTLFRKTRMYNIYTVADSYNKFVFKYME